MQNINYYVETYAMKKDSNKVCCFLKCYFERNNEKVLLSSVYIPVSKAKKLLAMEKIEANMSVNVNGY